MTIKVAPGKRTPSLPRTFPCTVKSAGVVCAERGMKDKLIKAQNTDMFRADFIR
jgi:hypothetical protein